MFTLHSLNFLLTSWPEHPLNSSFLTLTDYDGYAQVHTKQLWRLSTPHFEFPVELIERKKLMLSTNDEQVKY